MKQPVNKTVVAERQTTDGPRRRTQVMRGDGDLQARIARLETEPKALRNVVANNVERFILPALQRLRMISDDGQKRYLDLIEGNLRQLTSTVSPRVEQRLLHYLSPKEMQICNMIRYGFTSKDIAALLRLSPLTVHTHRNRIRKKLGLTDQRESLNGLFQRSEGAAGRQRQWSRAHESA